MNRAYTLAILISCASVSLVLESAESARGRCRLAVGSTRPTRCSPFGSRFRAFGSSFRAADQDLIRSSTAPMAMIIKDAARRSPGDHGDRRQTATLAPACEVTRERFIGGGVEPLVGRWKR